MEIWNSIPDYEGIYEASNFGRIRTAKGKTTTNARYPIRVWKQRILKQKITPNNRGRFDSRVCLWKDGKEKTFLVARLVASAFYGKSKLTVNHIDGNPLNNRADNLEWCSLKENIRKGFDTGLYSSAKRVRLVDDVGNVYLFKSMSEASRYLGRNDNYVSTMQSRGKNEMRSKDGKNYLCAAEVTNGRS